MAYLALEKLHQLHDGYRRCFRVGDLELMLIQDAGKVTILENRCPHMDAPLQYGTIQGGNIRCPLHGICFKLTTGEAVNTPAPIPPIRTFLPVYDGSTIGIEQ